MAHGKDHLCDVTGHRRKISAAVSSLRVHDHFTTFLCEGHSVAGEHLISLLEIHLDVEGPLSVDSVLTSESICVRSFVVDVSCALTASITIVVHSI